MDILKVNNLKVWDINTDKVIIHNSSFNLKRESCLAIVGESGSGKSMTCKSIMRLNKPWIRQSGEVLLKGENLNNLSEKEMKAKRGKKLCMILQNGMTAFDPSCVIGVHLKETLIEHLGWSTKQIEVKMKNTMESVMLRNPIEIMNMYPHQLSGGILQRVMIALALVLEPEVIIADEPTTALDTVSQFEVIEQFIKMRERIGSSMIFISHDLGIVKKIADEVLVMKYGKVIEEGNIETIFSNAKHEYTKHLISTKQALSNNFRNIMGEL
ncbi:staphylopine uptake ABC transporter ATP-binding protein CntD [Priestia megaterium]|jgi:nickel transport system ATP-binding protein|uniref:staphylopine uptake ABC transporter ATP-binding protein CntD n=1 Tax=Priestia megaterium TaxID=1404 RepID=UPI0013E2C519|nr:ABC transporter ATP-binding protein [Priestia megaterium]MDI3091849.1 ABC transporter ATP-binding protein [Priestia megaterium]MED3863914.1 ABC transporter ATP-binding protein [Priestia megaterium]MED4101030.1 ABC transporter ATP-binding protein [Priestia megaterium]MED4145417.1 ABC transporter ATP-binding protein [Priestia megaterium]MED4170663.1 ABC transporter ATP-binding protein [Priestia megaterium]